MLVRSVLYLQPRPGCRQALIDTFERIDVLGHAVKHEDCLSVEMLAPEDQGAPLAVIALWTGREGIQRWIDDPWRVEASRELDPLIEELPDRAVYDIVLATPSMASIRGEEATT